MVTIESLLQRIRWDPEFGHGEITIGYYDRIEGRIVTVPISHVHLEPGNHFSFTAVTADGSVHEVPLHRVREVRRDGVSIWHRTVPTDGG